MTVALPRWVRGLYVLLLTLFLGSAIQAQDRVISGKITDAKDGTPMVGATVTVKGSTRGVSTGADGTFRLPGVPASATRIVITSVGYATQEIDISNKSEVEVSLSATNAALNEVVVVGYGTVRKKDVTGSVATVKEKDFNKGVMTAPDQLIQGKVAGVQMLNNSGQPGGATTVRIRGNASVRAGNQPLYVVDGVPLDNNNARAGASSTGLGTSPGANPLNFINPNDIASMDVLKDASATAIYGSRGSNGVVIITTKRGQSGDPQITFNNSVGVSTILKKLEVLDANEYKAALTQYGLTGGNYGSDVDAMDAITRTGFTQNYNMSIAGGNDRGRYRISAGLLDQEGIIQKTNFKKYSGNISAGYKFLESKKLGLDFNLLTSHNVEELAPVTNDAGFQGNLIGQALLWNPTRAMRNADGSPFVEAGSTTVNPLAMLEAYNDLSNLTNVLGSISPSYKFTNDLEFRMLYSVRYASGNRRQEVKNWININDITGRGIAATGNNQLLTTQWTNTLSYNKRISDNFHLNAVAGYEYMKFQNRGSFLSAQDFDEFGLNYYDYLQYSTNSSRNIFSFSDPVTELQSYFGRATFNFYDKYLLTATFRADGSSKFGENNKYGYFPSFAAAWNIGNENFLKGSSFISNLKLRAGWGITGNQEFPAGASLTRYRFTGTGSTTRTNFARTDLKWEKSTSTNVGLDFGFFEDRFYGSVDYFHKNTEDFLFEQSIALPGPTGKYWINLPGNIINKGIELALNAAILRKKDLNWNIGAVATFQKNELNNFGAQIIETGSISGQGVSGTTSQRLANNQPLNVFYLKQYLGLDKTTGQSIIGNDETPIYAGSPNPDIVLGVSTDVNYKKWSFFVNFNGAFGHMIYNNTATSVLPIGNLGTRNIAKNLIGGDIQESRSNPVAASTRYLEKGDYLKLANATINYNLGKIGNAFRNVNISLTGQNLLIFTNYSGFDPEVNTDKSIDGVPSFGIEYTPYPSARTFMLGLNFTL